MLKNSDTFIGCNSDYKDSKIVMFGAPFDGTTSYRPGTRFASKAIRSESFSIETYSPYFDLDLEQTKVFDYGDLEFPFGNTQKVIDIIQNFTSDILTDNKIPFMIGGEHLVTLGAFKSVLEKYNDLFLIHFDAHTDLRDNYLGEKLSHSTVIRRCQELVGDKRIFQFGIRSGEKEEFEFGFTHNYFQKFNFKGIENIKEIVKDKPVYITLDLDVLDPSEFPGTGTPEAGGVSFKDLIQAFKHLSGLNIVAADVNELSPPLDVSGISTALACKVVRELLIVTSKL